jgi:type II secretory pathway component GspD/PulD (secretin)
VLNYLSEAAGFIIVLDAQPRGRVDVWSTQPVSKEEAVDLLNTVLNKNGFAAIRKGRTLTIINKDEAKTKALPVRSGGDPLTIPDNDEMVTQIIPVRFVEVGQLIKDLQPLVSTQTAMTANESGNAIVITDTQANIRRVAEVIKAIDSGAEDMTMVRVFRLQHADPQETADLLTSLFPEDSRSSGSQSPFAAGGGGGFRRMMAGGPFGGLGGGAGGGSSSSGQNQRIRKRNRVVAVADMRTGSVVVTASRDLMDQIEGVIAELDPDPANLKTVSVLPLQNAEPQEAMQVLQEIFQKSGTANSRNAQNQNSTLQNRNTQQSQQFNNNSGGANRTGANRTGSRTGL